MTITKKKRLPYRRPPEEQYTRGICVRLKPDEYDELKELTHKSGESLTEMGRRYFRQHLRKLRRRYGEQND